MAEVFTEKRTKFDSSGKQFFFLFGDLGKALNILHENNYALAGTVDLHEPFDGEHARSTNK